jgi:GNAT superfamily N-acetyltransferase
LADAEWLYARNPYGEAIVFAAFTADGELVAMRPAAAHKFWWRGQERRAYQFVDALVAPEHRNRGLFKRLIAAIGDAADAGDFSLFSFPNANSLAVYQKTAFLQCLGRCHVQVRIFSPVAYARYKLWRLGLLTAPPPPGEASDSTVGHGRICLIPIERFESDFPEVHDAVSGVAASFTLRRHDFLNWRYFGLPERWYQAAMIIESSRDAGYVVLRLINRVAHVVDLFVKPEPSLVKTVIPLVSQWARRLGAIALYFNTSHGNWFQRAVADAGGFLEKKSNSVVVDRATVSHLSILEGRPVGIADFYFVMGDGDFI